MRKRTVYDIAHYPVLRTAHGAANSTAYGQATRPATWSAPMIQHIDHHPTQLAD